MNTNFLDLFENDFIGLFPEIFLMSSTFFLLVYGVFLSTSKVYNYPSLIENIGWLSLFTLLYTIVLLIHNPINHSLLFFNVLILDDFTFFFKLLLLGSAFASICISFDYFQQEKINAFEYIILILFSTVSMLCMISSYDFISMYLTIELQSLCFYVLGASKRNSEFSTEAGLKYFILGAFSSGILLFGCSMIYGFTGITNFGELAKLFTGSTFVFNEVSFDSSMNVFHYTNGLESHFSNFESSGVIIGIIFIAVGFLFKLTAAPFHMWAPDVYEGSPTNITAFFSITPKIALFAIVLRLFLYSFYDLIFPWQKIIILCSLASMCVGALAALSQYKIKRLLAYSSIGHVGYLLIGLCCATIEGTEALFIYLIIYVIMTINIFAILLSLVGIKRVQFHNSSTELHKKMYHESFEFLNWSKMISSKVSLFLQSNKVELNTQSRNTTESNLTLYNSMNSLNEQGLNNSNVLSIPVDSIESTSTFGRLSVFDKVEKSNIDRSMHNIEFPRIKYLSDFAMLSKTNPILAFTLTCTMFSMAGIPPLAGFCSKFYIFFAALGSSFYFLAIFGVLTSVVSCFYYIRLIKVMYFEKPLSWITYQRMDREKSILLGITLFFIIFFFLYPSPIFLVAHKVALAISL